MEETIQTQKKSNLWMLSTIVLAAALVLSLTSGYWLGGITGAVILDSQSAGEKAITFLNDNIVETGEVQLVDVSKANGMFLVTTSYQGQRIPIHVTEDGKKLFVGEPMDMTESVPTAAPSAPAPAPSVPKTDKPKVELFIMSHCPFGTQAEKGFIPVMETLGDNADMNVRFVHYYMHTNNQEEVETPRQVCIREEQPDKFISYLKCFLGKTGTPEDAAACDVEVGINTETLGECISSGRADEYYKADSALSEQYRVIGSPTLIINGVQSNAGRSPASYLSGVCNAFKNAPRTCSESLDTANPSPGFGYSGSGSASAAQCG